MTDSQRSREQTASLPGEIHRGTLYTVAEVRARLKLGDWAWRKLRRSGLPIRKFGKQGFILGDELIDHVQKIPPNGA